MLINHIIKTIEYFSVSGFPEVSLDEISIIFNYLMKLGHIYITYFIELL